MNQTKALKTTKAEKLLTNGLGSMAKGVIIGMVKHHCEATIMKTTPKRSQVWCFACDRQLVAPGTKCAVCGAKLYAPSQRHNEKIRLLKTLYTSF